MKKYLRWRLHLRCERNTKRVWVMILRGDGMVIRYYSISIFVIRLIIALCLVISVPFARACDGDVGRGWQGRYEYQDGFSDGIQPIITQITLVVRDGKECGLMWNGYQKNEEIVCSTRAERGSMEIRFVSFAGGEIENEFGVVQYRKGEVLFTLERTRDQRLLTTWGERFVPPGVKKSGRYFSRR
ncbi:DUF5991 domain-containing protein [Burkholderia cepacia]|uniref:DUF5991 domain-containing protein n=1 Tax=Burkholderia cepacia TaxID=292 RepID=UPI0034515889